MAQAKQGDTVKVHYTGKLEDGSVFDSSIDLDPLQFEVGTGQVIPGFEQAVIGMSPDELKTIEVPADEAYGPYREEMAVVVDQNQFPADLNIEVGQQLQVNQSEDQKIIVMITDISESGVTLDANHPLAGKDLTFDIQLIEIV